MSASKILPLVMLLYGCSITPSHWDTNQARMIVNIRMEADAINCADPTAVLERLLLDIDWLQTYSSYKGTDDLGKMTKVVQKTISEFQASDVALQTMHLPYNVEYCALKKKIIIQQVDMIGSSFKGSLP